jgi:hypothetical protein
MATRMYFASAVAALALAAMPAAQAQNLAGSTVSVAGYCCTAPTEANRVTNVLTAVVGPDDEFPEGSLTSVVTGLDPLPVTIDVGSSTIHLTYSLGGTTGPGGFNGFVFSFADAPAIAGVSIDPAFSTYTPVVTFNENTVFINEAGLTLTPSSTLLLNVTAIPEPEAYSMMLGGLGIVSLMASRRRRKQRGAGRIAA